MRPYASKEQMEEITRRADEMHAALREAQHMNGMREHYNGPCTCDSCRERKKILRAQKEEKMSKSKHPEGCICGPCSFKRDGYDVRDDGAIVPVKPPGVNLAPAQRVSGELRSRYLDHLRVSYEQEYLDLSELEARMDAAMKSVTEADLERLICDLPKLPAEPVKITYKLPEKKEEEIEPATSAMAFAMASGCMCIIAVLSTFTFHSAEGIAIFASSTVLAWFFGLVAWVQREKK